MRTTSLLRRLESGPSRAQGVSGGDRDTLCSASGVGYKRLCIFQVQQKITLKNNTFYFMEIKSQ